MRPGSGSGGIGAGISESSRGSTQGADLLERGSVVGDPWSPLAPSLPARRRCLVSARARLLAPLRTRPSMAEAVTVTMAPSTARYQKAPCSCCQYRRAQAPEAMMARRMSTDDPTNRALSHGRSSLRPSVRCAGTYSSRSSSTRSSRRPASSTKPRFRSFDRSSRSSLSSRRIVRRRPPACSDTVSSADATPATGAARAVTSFWSMAGNRSGSRHRDGVADR